MSKYNEYAKRLNEAFNQAREDYEAVMETKRKAEEALSSAKASRDEKWPGERAARIHRAEDALAYVSAELNHSKIWNQFEATVKQIGAELEAAVKADSVASPDAIDSNALELLKSGIMDGDDYMAMLERFDDNPTMLRLVGKYAKDASSKDVPYNDRVLLNHVANAAAEGRSEVMRTWETLSHVALTYCGIKSIGKSYLPGLAKHWDDADVQSIVENF